MNIAVCIKQTPDTTTRVKIADDGRTTLDDNVQWVINPYDEAAIEEALRLTEQRGGEVTVVSLGPARVDKALREALAMGAHRAVRIHAEHVPADPLVTVRALADVLRQADYDLVFTGQQAVDDDNAQVPTMLATALDRAGITGVEELQVDDAGGTAVREFEGGRARVSFRLPAVIGVNRRLNDPRYPSFKGIMQAKKKPLDVVETDLSGGHVEVEHLSYPPEKGGGRLFTDGAASAAEVVRLLAQEAKVI